MMLHEGVEGLETLGVALGELEAPQVLQAVGDFMFQGKAEVPLGLLNSMGNGEVTQTDTPHGSPLKLPCPAGEKEARHVNGYENSLSSPHKVW